MSTGGLLDLSRIGGRLVEVSEAGFFGALSGVCGLMLQVQERLEQIAWIATRKSAFFPPDLAFRGLDIRAITVVKAPEPKAGLQATDTLLRSGAFCLIVVDWSGNEVDEAVLGRLARLADEKQTAVVFLTQKKDTEGSLGTQVAIRGIVSRTISGETEFLVVKDKGAGPPTRQRITFHGPFGLY